LTSLTVLTALTANIVDEVDLIGALCQQRQLGPSCPPSTQSIMSTTSMPSSKPPPAGGSLVVVTKKFWNLSRIGAQLENLPKTRFYLKKFFSNPEN
jgi:hypothetical protein